MAKTVAELMRHADAAMYQAKALGRRTLAFYSPDLQSANVQRFELESQLRLALSRHELSLHFQPQFMAVDGRLVGFEALLRWRTQTDGWIPPDRSSRWPKKPASSTKSATGCSTRPVGSGAGGPTWARLTCACR